MIASRDIEPNEELTVNYQHFDDDFLSYKDELI
jgi:SET domain-containing protein